MDDKLFEELDEEWEKEEVDESDIESANFVCEDCDYRWEEPQADEVDEESAICPMCGSVNVTLL